MSSYEAIGHRYARRSLARQQGLDTHVSVEAEDALVSVGVTLLGMSVALDRFLPITLGPFTPTFVLMIGLAVMGYWKGVTDGVVRQFRGWAFGFSAFAVVTLAAANALGSLKDSAGILLWFLGVPGLATVCATRRRFRALLLGLAIGASVLLVVVVSRFMRGVSLLDAAHPQLLGLNRNAIDLSIVWLIPPVLWSQTFNIPRFVRVAFVAASVLWLTQSEGRTGLIALLLVPLVFVLLQPSSGIARGVRVVTVTGVAALLYVGLTTISVPGVPAVERIAQYETSKRTSADEIRTLLNEKSIALGVRHPWVGVGFGRYEGQYDPVIDKGRTAHIRESSQNLPAHNTYYEIVATTGFPGFALFLGMLLVPLIGGFRYSTNRDVRAVTTGYAVVLFCIYFHTSYSSIISLPIALTLAAIARARAGAFAS